MSKLAWLCAILAFEFATAPAQSPGQAPKTSLATLTISLASTSVHQGDPITVTFLLKAGPKGAYVPDFFGDFITTCENGFSAAVITMDGASADPTARGCGRSIGFSSPVIAEVAFARFTRLAPGETRTWTTRLDTAAIPKGKYQAIGSYSSNADGIDEVAKLDRVHGLVMKGGVDSDPVPVEIK